MLVVDIAVSGRKKAFKQIVVTKIYIYKSFLFPGALLEKKTDLDKRGMGMSDYSNGMNKPLVCRPSALSKDPSDRTAFLEKVIITVGADHSVGNCCFYQHF